MLYLLKKNGQEWVKLEVKHVSAFLKVSNVPGGINCGGRGLQEVGVRAVEARSRQWKWQRFCVQWRDVESNRSRYSHPPPPSRPTIYAYTLASSSNQECRWTAKNTDNYKEYGMVAEDLLSACTLPSYFQFPPMKMKLWTPPPAYFILLISPWQVARIKLHQNVE